MFKLFLSFVFVALWANTIFSQEHPAFSLERGSSYYLVYARNGAQDKLELVDEQKREVEETISRARDDLGVLHRRFLVAEENERERILTEARERINEFDETLMGTVFLPHQRQAWKAMILRQHLERNGLFRVLYSGVLIELTDEQKKELRSKAIDEAAELEKQALALHEKSVRRLMEVLSKEQRDRLEDLLGSENIGQPNLSRYIDQLRNIDGSCEGCDVVPDPNLKNVVFPPMHSVLERDQ